MRELKKEVSFEKGKLGIVLFFDENKTETVEVTISTNSPAIFMLGLYSKQAENGKISEEAAGEKLLKAIFSLIGGDDKVFEILDFCSDNGYDFSIEELLTLIVESVQFISEGEVEEKKA